MRCGVLQLQTLESLKGVRDMTRTMDSYFADWEREAFGYGYGTGEQYTILAVRAFFALCTQARGVYHYDYEELEARLVPIVAWLLINVLAGNGLLDYGTSPRYGWLTENGKILRDYMLQKNIEDLRAVALHEITEDRTSECCCCGSENGICPNPFWRKDRKAAKKD